MAALLCACQEPLLDRCEAKEHCPEGYSCDTEQGLCVLDSATDAGMPDAEAPDRPSLDSALADGAPADASVGDVLRTDAELPDAAQSDSAEHDAAEPDSAQPDSAQPDAAEPDSAEPDAARADAASADVGDSFPDSWWDPAWSRRTRLRFHNTDQTEDLSDFPVLVRLTTDNFDYSDEVNNGLGLRFVSSDGEVLPYEVERWVRNGKSELWLAIPGVVGQESSSYIYLYSGNPDPPVSSSTEVWPAAYQLVLLFKGSTVDTALADSSRWQRNVGGTYSVSMPSPLANGMYLGQQEVVEVPSLDLLGMPQTSGTYSILVELSSWTTASADLLGSFWAVGDRLWLSVSSNKIWAEATLAEGPPSVYRASSDAPGSGWTRVSMVWDKLQGELSLYLDGVRKQTTSLPPDWQPSDQDFRIRGTGMDDPDGIIDDVRLSNVARSPAWLSAEWEVVQDNFVVFEDAPTPPQPEVFGGIYAGTPVVLYEFDEGSGDLVADSSGYGSPLDLHIADPAHVEWLNGALRIKRATVIESDQNADKIAFACGTANAFSVEAWLQPDHALFEGPARVATMGGHIGAANFMFGQDVPVDDRDDAHYVLRLRHNNTDNIGRMRQGARNIFPLSGDDPAHRPRQERSHVVFTFDGAQVCSYVDGALHPDGCEPWAGVILGEWSAFLLRLANERDNASSNYVRPWLGTLYRVAIYCQTLNAAQVQQNFAAGTGY